MEFSYSHNKHSYAASFTYNEDDRLKTYYVSLTQPDQKQLLGDQVTICFSKVKNDYEASAQSSPVARDLEGSIVVAIEQLEKNKG